MSVEDAIKTNPIRNAPCVAVMISESNKQYFMLMEQTVLCEVPSLPQALFVAFGCYYVYNLEYPTKASNIFFFFQDYLLGYLDSYVSKGYVSGIICYVPLLVSQNIYDVSDFFALDSKFAKVNV